MTTGVRSLALVAAAVLVALAPATFPSPARASGPPTPWDGTNPFNCVVQDAGLGATGPDPGADPYCVNFDKTNQNITQLGIVDFLLQEPARTAAAAPKCFYFQEDHWRGTVAQSDSTAVYEFEGHYFFNKASGDGGVWVTNFRVDGQTFDPSSLPGFPPQYGQYFGPGTGGFITHNDVPVDPSCVAQAAGSPPYPPSAAPRCVPDTGKITPTGLGPVAIGTRESAVRSELGPPGEVKRGFLHYCVVGGGSLLIGQPGDRSGSFGSDGTAPTEIVLATARGFVLPGRGHHSLTVGAGRRAIRRAFPRAHLRARMGATRVLSAGRTILIGERHGRVQYLAVYDRSAIATKRSLSSFLARSVGDFGCIAPKRSMLPRLRTLAQ
jgi:hypothetical protein